MGRWRLRLISVLAAMAIAIGAMAGGALTTPARAGVASTTHLIPGGNMPASSGVTTQCYDGTGFSCTGAGYNGTSAQIGGNGWTTSQYWSWGSAGPNGTKHNCTTYAAYRLQQDGTAYPGWTGYAYQWAQDAANSGVLVDQTPAIGAIAQWNQKDPYGGHVAYVEAVTSTYIVTSSDSFDGGTDRQEIPLTSPYMPDNFIHFNDYYGDIVQWSGDTSAQKTSWRVGEDGRRHWIPTISDYWCQVDGGVPAAIPLPSDVLDTVIPDDAGSQAPCGGDLNGDGIVNSKDLAIMASEYGTSGPLADINLDGKVSLSDLAILAQQWGKKPAPSIIKTAAGTAIRPAVTVAAPGSLDPAELARPTEADGVGALAGNDISADPSVSADGNIVVFSSLASNLVPGDTNGVLDVFAWNRSAGTVTRVSADSAGVQLSTASTDATISPNGRYVAFDSGGDVYLKDLTTGVLDRISEPNGDPTAEPNEAAYADDVTSSGLVVFESKATNLVVGDTSGASGIFARQLLDGPIEQVSVSSDDDGGVEANADSYSAVVTGDGQYVAFVSRATNLAAGNADGQAGIFVRNLTTGTTILVSGPSAGGQADGDAESPSISANGNLVAFSSDAANLAGADPGGYQQVYVRNLGTGTLERASQVGNGTAGNGDSTEPTLSSAGSRVAFESEATNLVTGDTNDADDIFVQDLADHLISRVSVTPGLAQADSSSFGPALSSGGTVVVFSSDAINLTGAPTGTPEQIVVRDITRLPLSAGTPTITGTAKVGDSLSAHAGTWGPSGVSVKYQWYASGQAIKGATGTSRKLTAAQYAKRITVTVTVSITGYAAATATTSATAKVGAGTLTAARPTITGTAKADDTLTAHAGAWGPSGVALKYQWYASGRAITGATGRTLKLSGKSVGKTITVTVTGKLNGYTTTARTSKPTKKIAP